MTFLFSLFLMNAAMADDEAAPPANKSEVVPTRSPVTIIIPNLAKNAVSEEEVLLMETISRIASSKLSYYKTYPVELPPTIFTQAEFSDGIVLRKDLENLPLNAGKKELHTLAFDKDGNIRDLSKSQRKSIRKTGMFTVDSLAFPGKSHTWKLSKTLQKGTTENSKSMSHNLRWGLSRLVVHAPDRLFSNDDFSIRKGLSEGGGGLRSMGSLLLGMREYKEIDKADWIEERLDKPMYAESGAFGETRQRPPPPCQ